MTPSGLTSVVSTVAGGLETPDFLELRKTSNRQEEPSGPRSLYQVVPEKQTTVRGLMGSERGYDVAAVAGTSLPVLGEERGTKVRSPPASSVYVSLTTFSSGKPTASKSLSTNLNWVICRRTNCASGTRQARAAMLASKAVVTVRSGTVLRKKLHGRSSGRRARRARTRSSSSDRGTSCNSLYSTEFVAQARAMLCAARVAYLRVAVDTPRILLINWSKAVQPEGSGG